MIDGEDKYLGAQILGQYMIERVLKTGGMGTVYLAQQLAMDRSAAIKILRSVAKTKDRRQRFHTEARAASRLLHPNIITVYNFGELDDGTLFMAMEFVEGVTLSEVIGKEKFPLLQAVRIAQQCADALGYAHGKNVIHRDFKPSNVIISQFGQRDHVKVLDFGLARLVGETTTTQSGSLLGTPRYMPPEQWMSHAVTEKADQYALGQVLWEMIAGCLMVDSPWPLECMRLHVEEIPASPSDLRTDAGIEFLDPVVARMMAKDPADRFNEMQEVVQVLQEVTRKLEWCHTGSGARPAIEYPAGPPRGETDQTISSGRSDSSVRALRSHPASVLLLGETAVSGWDDDEMRKRHGLISLGRCASREQLSTQEGEPDLYLIVAPRDQWQDTCALWFDAEIPVEKTLVCITAPEIDPGLADAVVLCQNLLISTRTPDPEALAVALSWMRWGASGAIELLWSKQPIMMRQLSSPSLKSSYVDDLLEDAMAAGVRKRTLRSLTELSEEMVTHAFFWAPADRSSIDTRLSQLQQQGMTPGQAYLHWVFADRFIGLSLSDLYGALTPRAILSNISGSTEGRGFNLRIMFQAARHLFFATCPGTWSEVMALVDRKPKPAGSFGGHSLCILQGLRQREGQIGGRLKLDEKQDQGRHRCVKLRGEIDETCDFRPIFQLSGRVVVDMSDVNRINSMGIQAWIIASRNASKDLELDFEGCSLAVVSQLNMIPEFANTGRIISIHAPYGCPKCGKELLALLQVDEIRDKQPPAKHCTDCNTELVFDDLAELYFSFMDKR